MISLSRMFRALQIPVWVCPMPARESHLSAFIERIGSGHGKHKCYEQMTGKGFSEGESSRSTVSCFSHQTSPCSDWKKYKLKLASSENFPVKGITSICHQQPEVSPQPKHVSYVNAFNRTLLPMVLSHRPLSCTQCNSLQSHQLYRRIFVSPFSLSTHKRWASNECSCKSPPFSHFIHQTRAAHQAAQNASDIWRDCLSPENETRCRKSLGSNRNLYEMDKGKRGKNQERWASILVCLCSVKGEPAFLFTLRSSTLKGKHKGDVSFAGGKSDPVDKDVVATALREAWEEMGVKVPAEKVWGVMKPLRDRSGMMIVPVLANLGPLEELTFKPNHEEVEEIFTLSISHLCNPKNCGYTHFRVGDKVGYTLPVFRNGKHRVWGLTAVALDQTLKLLLPS